MTLIVHRATHSMLDQVKERCIVDHYLHRWPDPRSLPFAYYLDIDGQRHARDGRLLGIVVLKKPEHHKQRHLFGYPGLPTSWQVLDLARVWLHPTLQRKGENGHSLCIFSQIVSRVMRRVQVDWLDHHPPRFPSQPYHIEVVISYCDLDHHDGKAYRASGFTWGGYSSDMSKELYYRKLRPPLKAWKPTREYQMPLPLFSDLPLVHK